MFKLLIFVIFRINIIVQCEEESASISEPVTTSGRVLGGIPVNTSDVPYLISLQYSQVHRCGAVLISQLIAMTTAHCGHGLVVRECRMRIGSSKQNSGGILVRVKQIIIHPDYKVDEPDNNFAIMKLANYTEYLNIISYGTLQLPKKNEILGGTVCRTCGWGKTFNAPEKYYSLKAVQVTLINQDSCKKFYNNLTPRMICAGFLTGGRSACNGDSFEGDPLTLDNKILVGLDSYRGTPCTGPNLPNVYSRIDSVLEWIQEASGGL